MNRCGLEGVSYILKGQREAGLSNIRIQAKRTIKKQPEKEPSKFFIGC